MVILNFASWFYEAVFDCNLSKSMSKEEAIYGAKSNSFCSQNYTENMFFRQKLPLDQVSPVLNFAKENL